MKTLYILFVICLVGMSNSALGQELDLSPIAETGTYQFLVPNPKVKAELFPNSILLEIEALRHEQITKTVKIGEHTWVRILSREIIEGSNFIPLSDEVGVMELEGKLIRPEK